MAGRIMGINKSTVYNCIKKLDEKLQNTYCTEENTVAKANTTKVIEMDKFFDYIKVKKRDLRNNIGNKKTATNRKF